MRIFTITLTLLLVGILYTLFTGKNGILDYQQVQDEINVQQKVNNSLQERNNEMFAEIDDLRQGLDAIEERARHQLGMIKEGETFYRIIDNDFDKKIDRLQREE